MLGAALALLTTFVVSFISYGAARRFVRERLRYVEAALTPAAAIIAGIVALCIASPVVAILHIIPLLGYLVGGGTALVFGMSVGFGVNAGAKDVKNGYVIGPGR